MAGALFLARLTGGPRDGQQITIGTDDDGEPPDVIEVPDWAGIVEKTSRYRLRDRDDHVYVYEPAPTSGLESHGRSRI